MLSRKEAEKIRYKKEFFSILRQRLRHENALTPEEKRSAYTFFHQLNTFDDDANEYFTDSDLIALGTTPEGEEARRDIERNVRSARDFERTNSITVAANQTCGNGGYGCPTRKQMRDKIYLERANLDARLRTNEEKTQYEQDLVVELEKQNRGFTEDMKKGYKDYPNGDVAFEFRAGPSLAFGNTAEQDLLAMTEKTSFEIF